MLETWFWTQNQCFEAWGIIWDNFKKPQIDLNAKNWVQELNVVLTLEIQNNANQPNTLVFLTQQVDCRLSPYKVPKLHVQNLHGSAHDVWCEFRPPVATSWSIQ